MFTVVNTNKKPQLPAIAILERSRRFASNKVIDDINSNPSIGWRFNHKLWQN